MFRIKNFLQIFFIVSFFFLTWGNVNASDSVILQEGLVVKLPRGSMDNIITPDAILKNIVEHKWQAPSENREVTCDENVTATWQKISADENGWFQGEQLNGNSYVYFKYTSGKEQIVLIEAMANHLVYVNGKVRSGNPYRYKDEFEDWGPRFDYSFIPVKLKRGDNEILFHCRRGLLKAKLHLDQSSLLFADKDLTTPDLIINESVDTHGAVPVINASEKTYGNVFVKTWIEGATPQYYPVKRLYPLSIYKTPFYIKLPVQTETGKVKFNIEIVADKNSSETLASTVIELNVVTPNDTHKETFISEMDGSVQYYAVNPPSDTELKSALFLSLHGAGVEAINQAQSYSHKNWGYLVAATNRRPYGYNWENWGRLDALEVLEISKEKFDIDKERVYLTGHSMGGHGTWHVGFNNPDKFAAIAPSAGWISIWSYRILSMEDSNDVKNMLMRSTKQSDTYAFTTNLKKNGIYILHGDADDNVPVGQAESIIENISKFHKNYSYHFEKGAGHWWDNSEEPGADCVDWMPMFDFFAQHSLPGNERVREIDFTTANPSAASKNYWVEIINQVEQQKLSNMKFELYPGQRLFNGRTENISKLVFDVSVLKTKEPVSVEIDGQKLSEIKIPEDNKIIVELKNDKWEVADKVDKCNKYPARCGNFREAFNHRVLFVYAAHGSSKENKWAFEKARYDAEKIWYRGNSSIEIIKDDEFKPELYKDRSVILFGNSETNSAWELLLNDSPVQVNGDEIVFGDKKLKGEDFACLMIRPRKDSDIASVAVVAGTGVKGFELTELAPYFNQYMSLPDLIIYDSEVIESDQKGVKITGYFGNDWSINKGEFVIQ
ncbi:MAG: prolyl oligopeptidase family serine peptidase [Ignavibacteria bacterium]|jgi:poly(3-hydroxybutyrate) depolymerase